MAAIAHFALGLSGVLMVFHSGGGLSYLQLPAFGYIAGFYQPLGSAAGSPNAMTLINSRT